MKVASAAAAVGIVRPMRGIADLELTRPIRDGFAASEGVGSEPREIAARAIDAARSAGASFADARVDRQTFQSVSIRDAYGGNVGYSENIGVGIRVIADGQWGFVSIDAPTIDGVADAARRAVHQAHVNAARRKTGIDLVSTPVVKDGRWATRVRVDPFSVAVGEQQEALVAGAKAALAVSGIKRVTASVRFLRVERTFASTEGSEIAQTFTLVFPSAFVMGTVADEQASVTEPVDGLHWKVAGYEVVPEAKLSDTMKAAAEKALDKSRASLTAVSPRSVDVGRYELVVGARILSGMVQGTILSALGMERALGKRVDDEGTSYAAPPEQVLGALQIGHPLLTVKGDRSTPGGLMTAAWDDEGVAPNDCVFLDNGVVNDYVATRENASKLGWWYAKRGAPVRSHGNAATSSWGLPREATPNLTIAAGATAVTVDDMIKDVKRGIYLSGSGGAGAGPGLMNAYGGGSVAQEIRNGKLVGQLKDVAIQFQVQSFWKGLQAIGGPGSVETFTDGTPVLFACRTVRSVPARFTDVNVVNTGRTQ